MFKFVTRMMRKNKDHAEYHLPSDNPEINPILVEEDGEDVTMEEVAVLNSSLLTPVMPDDPAGLSYRTRAIVEMKTGLADLGEHIRLLGQRLQAQSIGQGRLIEALSGLPETLRAVLPQGEDQTRALAALKLALDEQTDANRHFVQALKPLPRFIEAAASLPETAKQQLQALTELTRQFESSNLEARRQGEQVRVLIETLHEDSGQQTEQVKQAVQELAVIQKGQLKAATIAAKAAELARRSQRRYHAENAAAREQLASGLRADQSRRLNSLNEQVRKAFRKQFAVAGAAVGAAALAITFAVLLATGVIRLSPAQPDANTVEQTTQGATETLVQR
jgi:hypothetical protein